MALFKQQFGIQIKLMCVEFSVVWRVNLEEKKLNNLNLRVGVIRMKIVEGHTILNEQHHKKTGLAGC